MGSETEGSVLDIHFGNKTDVDSCTLVSWKRTQLASVKKTVWSYPADSLLGYDRLYEHHTYGSNEDPPGSTISATCR
jgi:hypothetical protein